jgi:predicted PurR-regulated permease PerM
MTIKIPNETGESENSYRTVCNRNYTKIALCMSVLITLVGLIATFGLTIPFQSNDDEISKCKVAQFLNLTRNAPHFRYCQSGINLALNDTLNHIHDQMQSVLTSKFQSSGNVSKVILNHIVCLLITKANP